jgi:hypothetical protein
MYLPRRRGGGRRSPHVGEGGWLLLARVIYCSLGDNRRFPRCPICEQKSMARASLSPAQPPVHTTPGCSPPSPSSHNPFAPANICICSCTKSSRYVMIVPFAVCRILPLTPILFSPNQLIKRSNYYYYLHYFIGMPKTWTFPFSSPQTSIRLSSLMLNDLMPGVCIEDIDFSSFNPMILI